MLWEAVVEPSCDVCLQQEEESGEITFYMKGADMVMQSIVQYNDWLDEEVCV